MTNAPTLTAQEQEFIEITRAADDAGREFIFNSLICAVEFGNDFFNEVSEHVKAYNAEQIAAVVDKYITRFKAQMTREGA